MSENKLALDNASELKLLTDLWNIEKMVENEESGEALKAIKKLIEEVRYSEIIDSYTLFDAMDEMREEDVIDEIKSIVKEEPNDIELGGKIRAYVNNNLK